MEKNRLSKIMAAAGVASRRACEQLIFDGQVKVNGKIVKVPQTMVSLDTDNILVNGMPINAREEKVYYILNKPKGYLCTSKRIGDKKIVLDLFPNCPLRLFTAGRLDRETLGLLIVTNDGHFANKVMHPSSEITKEYLVKTEQEVTEDHLKIIRKGAFADGDWVRPLKALKVRKGTIKICVAEGKKREVRSLVEKADLKILELKRIRIGGLTLGDLPVGKYRTLTEHERETIFQ